MVQKTPKKTTNKTTKKTTAKAAPKKAKKPSTALEVVQPKPVPAVIPTPKQPVQKSFLRTVLTTILFIATLVIWFFVGQKAFFLVTQDLWLTNGSRHARPVTQQVVASVDGQAIFISDVKDFANTIPQLAELPFDVIYPQLLETMIDSKVLLKAAEKAGIDKLPDVQKALQLSRDQILSQAYLLQQLEKTVTPEQLQAAYDAEMQHFKPVDEVRASHILVKTEKEAKDIIIQLKAGADFATLANTKSIDKNSMGGDLGYFTEDMMIPEFGKAVFAMTKGQLSAPIHTPFGWHVVLLKDRRPAKAPTFDDVKAQLRQVVMEQNASRVMAEERKNMNVRVYVKRVKK